MVSICIVLIISVISFTDSAYENIPDEKLSMTQFIIKHGYPVETHKITTSDGYVLGTQRIPHGKESKITGDKIAFLVHGMAGSAENYITLGPNNALAFMLADRGFDVWLFNARGTTHSRRHINLLADFFHASTFWNFSWHEIGIYDLTANIDYILRKTGKSQLFYVGHSQGVTSYFVMTSEKPEYNSKIKVAALMAPPLIMTPFENHLLRMLALFHPLIEKITNIINYHELPVPQFPALKQYLKSLCLINEDLKKACMSITYLLAGQESGLFNMSMLSLLLTHSPSSFGTRQALHFAQGIKSGEFKKYDYGVENNLRRYNQKSPPKYNLNNSVAPVATFFGNGDSLASIQVKDHLTKIIPNVVMTYEVPYNRFNHIDFLFGMNVKELLYEHIYELFMRFEK